MGGPSNRGADRVAVTNGRSFGRSAFQKNAAAANNTYAGMYEAQVSP